MQRGACRLVKAVDRDQTFVELQYNILKEFEEDPEHSGPTFRKIVAGAISALSGVKSPESPVELNAECVVMLEDIAAFCRKAYPWPLVKLLLLVVWSHAFDEVYELEQSRTGKVQNKEEFCEERRLSLSLLSDFESPPLTLQRLTEITLRQPYTTVSKLVHAYRKSVLVRPLTEAEVGTKFALTSEPSEADDIEVMRPVEATLSSWAMLLQKPIAYQWDEDIWLGLWESKPVEESSGAIKRPLEA
ncbi:PPP4R2, putative [Babesia ovata]|uniref:PPP4R2, putative n=1 Tax=Babesia ovata TaxID=189622 RepID=A0A2H6KCM0_9APIC|nr:PPP4R2, putative [Babesia ovata]GBE60741.1 PPP4R2, putative [Babesia ovata]